MSDRSRRIYGSDDQPSRPGFEVDRQGTAMAFSLYVESMDGRTREAMPWALYNGYKWCDDPRGEGELLTILFTNRAVLVRGLFMKPQLRAIEGCRLKGICQNTPAEQAEIEDWNMAHPKEPEKILAIVTRIELAPISFQDVVNATLSRREPDDNQDGDR